MDDATGWRVTASAQDPGWLEIPPRDGLDAEAWIRARAQELQQDWGARWRPEHDLLVPAALEHALESRRPDDALCFQYWPVRELRAALVHVAFGAVDEPIDWSAADGALSPIELPEVGPGVQRVFRAQASADDLEAAVDLIGVDIVCSDGRAVVHVRLEPTLPGFAADVVPSFHAFAASIAVDGPAGRFRSSPSAGLAPGADGVWADGAFA